MAYYVGLDVSQKQTWICVVDDKGKVVAEGCSLTRAADVYGWLGNRVERDEIVKVTCRKTAILFSVAVFMRLLALSAPSAI